MMNAEQLISIALQQEEAERQETATAISEDTQQEAPSPNHITVDQQQDANVNSPPNTAVSSAMEVTESEARLILSQAEDIIKRHALNGDGPVGVHALQSHSSDSVPTLEDLELIARATPATGSMAATVATAVTTAVASSDASSPMPKEQVSAPSQDPQEAASVGSPSSPNSNLAALTISEPIKLHPLQERFDKHPYMTKILATEWEAWLEKEKVYCRWNLVRFRSRDKPTYSRGPTASEWSREYHCEHAGHYRDRKNPDISPKKKRKRGESIKCGCTAIIKIKKQFQEDEVAIEYYWKHEGHTPGVPEDIRSQRLPLDLKAWIKRRIAEGCDWKTTKSMLQRESPLLDELTITSKQNAKQYMHSCYSLFANTNRALNKNNSRSASRQLSEQPPQSGTVIQFSGGDQEMPLAQKTSESVLQGSKGQDGSHNAGEGSSKGSEALTGQGQATWQLTGAGALTEGLQQRLGAHDGSTLAVHSLPSTSSSGSIQTQGDIPMTDATNNVYLAQMISSLQRTSPMSADAVSQNPTGNHQSALAELVQVTQPSEAVVKAAAAGVAYKPEDHQGTISSSLGATNGTLLAAGEAGSVEQKQQHRQAWTELLATLRSIADLHKEMEASGQRVISQEDTKQITDSFAFATGLLKDALERSSQSSSNSNQAV
ncbi:hypothetical protein BGZ94_002453 [Podila epigama]|nr:hypothetical protein BGZ94_002453 [Podila epigama]